MDAELKKKYCNVTRQVIDLYLARCEQCQLKEKIPKRGLVVRPILSHYMNSRCQVDLNDMQCEPEGYYRFIKNYQNHFTKFTTLRPLKSKTAEEVAYQLMDIFCIFGAPVILQSDNGCEYANKIIQNLADMWPGMKLVHGKARHSQSQGSVERSNQDVRDMLVAWMSDNNTNTWSEGLRFIQSKPNRALHSGIKTSPYEAMFGTAQRIGLGDSPLTEDMYSSIETEELEQLFNAGMNNGRDKEEANQQDRKDEDENQTNDTSEERVEKKNNKKIVYYLICEKESSGAHKCSVCDKFVHAICGSYSEDSEGFGLIVTCNLCVRKNRITIEREGAKSGQEQEAQKMGSLSNSRLPAVDIGANVVVRVPDLDRGRLVPQKCPSSRRRCQRFWTLSVGHEERPT